jgi:hypothetical protein
MSSLLFFILIILYWKTKRNANRRFERVHNITAALYEMFICAAGSRSFRRN